MVKVLSRDEQATLLFKALESSPRNYAIIMTMLQTGVRVGELVGLVFDDILIGGHFKTALTVRAETSKSGREREIPISKRLKDVLQDYIAVYQQKQGVIHQDDPLFQQANRVQALSTRQVERIVAKLSKEAIGRKIHPHLLRHTFGTNTSRVAPIRVVMELLGHTNIASTQIYLHPNNVDLKQAVDKLE
ncbi:MAG: site-specific integrase [Actinomycetia bacterium]|nr:site-specific integrase [Actinomycetes bacterium]